MINYTVYILILLILVFVFVIAAKAMRRGIKAKQKLNKDNEYEGTFYAGYPLQVGSKATLEIDSKEKIVFFAHPSPKAKAEKVKDVKNTKTETPKASDSTITVQAEDFKSFAQTMEKLISQHSEERQSFLQLVNTLQDRIFVLENQLTHLKAPQKSWYQFWK